MLDGVFPPPPHSEQKRARTVPVSGFGELASDGPRLSGTLRPTAVGKGGRPGSARFWTDRREVIVTW